MSRTYRRKNNKSKHPWIESKEEFDIGRASYLDGVKAPTYSAQIPRPLVRELSPWGRPVWVEASYGTPEYAVWRRKAVANWCSYTHSTQYIAYSAKMSYRRAGRGKATYNEYVRADEALFHSDNGMRTHNRYVPNDFISFHCTRPERRLTKQLIHRGIELDNWDELIFPEPTQDAYWWYY